MSLETGVVVGKDGRAIMWHVPEGRTAGSLPDSRGLWKCIWENRDELVGFAHSHPGRGLPGPSQTDLTTFEAIEAALGKSLQWWICSEDRLVLVWKRQPNWVATDVIANWQTMECGRNLEHYEEPPWLGRLRWLSYNSKQGG